MSWRCSSLSNEGLVENLCKAGIVHSKRVADAMTRTDRAKYMCSGDKIEPAIAYKDSPHPIGFNQTISAPHMHAYALEIAESAIEHAERPQILDVGSGSGYLSACLSRMVEQKGGKVFGIERIADLVTYAISNVKAADNDLFDNSVLQIHCADGWKGLPDKAPFHFIHVGAAADKVPQALHEQLAIGGRMVIPIGDSKSFQHLTEVRRIDHSFVQRKLMSVAYVPLVRDECNEL